MKIHRISAIDSASLLWQARCPRTPLATLTHPPVISISRRDMRMSCCPNGQKNRVTPWSALRMQGNIFPVQQILNTRHHAFHETGESRPIWGRRGVEALARPSRARPLLYRQPSLCHTHRAHAVVHSNNRKAHSSAHSFRPK